MVSSDIRFFLTETVSCNIRQNILVISDPSKIRSPLESGLTERYSMQTIDHLIHARWIIPVEPSNTVLENHAIAIQEGSILEILHQDVAKTTYSASTNDYLNEHVLIPGLINAHTHSPMSLFRGLADDLHLMEWLNQHIWPAEKKWVNEEFIRDGTQLAIAEMLRAGITHFNDMYFFPEITARVASNCGIRATVGLIVLEFPSAWAENANEYLRKGLALHDEVQHDPLIRTAFAPHAPYTVSDETFTRIRTYSDEMQTPIPIHLHLHETQDEIDQSIKDYGMRPIERLNKLGLLSPSLLAVHMTQLTEDEILMIKDNGVHILHCPESNLKLASGFCPVDQLARAGVNICLGTDGAASNNDLDILSEMRTAALLAKAVAGDAAAIPAEQALRMATINGARALGIENETGSLEPGKAADITAIQLTGIESQPLYHPISQLVYATGRNQVTDVWVNGQHLLNQRHLTTLDEHEILEKTSNWREKIMTSAH